MTIEITRVKIKTKNGLEERIQAARDGNILAHIVPTKNIPNEAGEVSKKVTADLAFRSPLYNLEYGEKGFCYTDALPEESPF